MLQSYDEVWKEYECLVGRYLDEIDYPYTSSKGYIPLDENNEGLNCEQLKGLFSLLLNHAIDNMGRLDEQSGRTSKDLIASAILMIDAMKPLSYHGENINTGYEYLSNQEFLEKYSFLEDIDFKHDYLPAIQRELSVLFTLHNYIESMCLQTRVIKEFLSKASNAKPTGYEEYLWECNDRLKQKYPRLEIYLVRSLQYWFNNYPYLNNELVKNQEERSEIYNPHFKFRESYRSKDSPVDFVFDAEDDELYYDGNKYIDVEKMMRLFYGTQDYDYEELAKVAKRDLLHHFTYLYNLVQAHGELEEAFKALKRGYEGELAVQNYIREYLPKDWIILENVNIPYKGGQRENDVIIINKKGIFTIEVKNYKAGSITVKNDGKVIHKIGNQVIEEERDIIQQSEDHVNALSVFLSENYPIEGVSFYELVKGLVVISNEEMEINNESVYPIFRTNLLRPYLLQDQEDRLTDEDIEAISKVIHDKRKPDVKYKYSISSKEAYDPKNINALYQSSYDFINHYIYLLSDPESQNVLMDLSHSFAIYPYSENKENSYTRKFIRTRKYLDYLDKFFPDENKEAYKAFEEEMRNLEPEKSLDVPSYDLPIFTFRNPKTSEVESISYEEARGMLL